MLYQVYYEIRSGIDNHHEVIASGDVTVRASNYPAAKRKATTWIRENDSHFDERIDPSISIVSTENLN